MNGIYQCRRPGRLLAMASFALMAAAANAQLSGAIWTTTSTGTKVNGNIYDDCNDVYLNGGPQNTNGGKSLPDGIYFFQVTTPSGKLLLSNDNADKRLVKVVGGKVMFRCHLDGTTYNPPAGEHPLGSYNGANLSMPFQLMPFDETTNNGGEYKAWLILREKASEPGVYRSSIDPENPKEIVFAHRWAKTDNFKCRVPDTHDTGRLRGVKFFDLNNNGKLDLGDERIKDFAIEIKINPGTQNEQIFVTYTGAAGKFSFPPDNEPGLDAGTTYEVCELLPPDAAYNGFDPAASLKWVQTAPGTENDDPEERCYSGTIDGDVENLDFGNTQMVKLCGLKFYDRNMDGVKQENEPPLSGFVIRIKTTWPGDDPKKEDYTVVTGTDGTWCSDAMPINTCYEVSENAPGGNWLQTGPKKDGAVYNLYKGKITVGAKDGMYHDVLLDKDFPIYTVRYNQPDVENLNFGNIQQARLKGMKFFDTNGNGQKNTGEPGIKGWKIKITLTLPNGKVCTETIYTDSNGCYQSKLYPDGTQYKIEEIMPPGDWMQTFPSFKYYTGTITGGTPTSINFTIPNITGKDFGNRFCPPVNAHTKGYWHNKNGYDTMNDGGTIVPEMTLLNNLPLVRLNGSPADFNIINPSAGFTDFSNWITNDSNGSNMACQLSAQLAAMTLNVEAGFVAGSQWIYAPGTQSANSLGIAVLSDLMEEARLALLANPITVVASSARTKQNAIMTALDKGNNNLTWLCAPITSVPPY